MNKQEIERKLEQVKIYKEGLEKEIKDLLIEIDELKDSDKKPKLRRGDFGMTSGGSPYIRINDDIHWLSGITAISELSPDDLLFTEGRYGNLVDLMNGWSEPFEEFRKYGIYLEPSADAIFIDASGSHLTISEAEEFWRALGHLIVARKQAMEK